MDIEKMSEQLAKMNRLVEVLSEKLQKVEADRKGFLKEISTAEAYEKWLIECGIPHARLEKKDVSANWWVVKVDENTATLVLQEKAQQPECPCLCCHDRMSFSPYEIGLVEEDSVYRHPSKGFRKEWADWLVVVVCVELGVSRLEVYGADSAQQAQQVTPLPLEWFTYRDYKWLERVVLSGWFQVRQDM